MKKIFLTSILLMNLTLFGCISPVPAINNDDQIVPEKTTKPAENNNVLDLSGQGLTEISQEIFKKTNLEKLDISNNKLTGALPAEIRQLQNLKILDASNNTMTGVPAEIGQLQNLQTLDLSNNQLTGLPYELGNLKNLKTLNLSGNNYSSQDLEIIRTNLPANVNIIL
ncbi:MAG: leucine-rich repeat domain-containing protein [Candidatus Buchananbacteria bacterium]|nr:leucine-rich repeat domain-containing protein [Candidatus Buchananbacteria bacterium]